MTIDVKSEVFARTLNTNAADFHPTQPWLLTSSSDGDVTIYDIESGQVIHTFSLSPVAVSCVKFIARKNWYIVGSYDGTLRVFSYNPHKQVVTFDAHSDFITCIAVHPTDSVVLTSSWDNTIKAWDWGKKRRNNSPFSNCQTYICHTSWVRSIAFDPKNPNAFASACDDGTVKMWSITSSIPDFTIKAHDDVIFCVDFYPGGDKSYLITGSRDCTVKVWDYLTKTCVRTMETNTHGVSFAAFHPSLPIIISGSWDGILTIWNSKSYEIERTFNYKLGLAACIALRKDSRKVVVGFKEAILTLELAQSVLSQTAVSSGDVTGEVSKEQVQKNSEDLNIEELAMSITTGIEPEPEPAQSLDSLTTAYVTAPSQAYKVHQLSVDSYQHCSTLAMELIAIQATNKLISELRDDKAQHVVDFLSKMVNDKKAFTQRQRKYSLQLLSKLAKSAGAFPQSLELEGVRCNLSSFVVAGGYGFIYRGEHEGTPVCVKAVQIGSQGIDRKKMRAHTSELTIWGHVEHPNVLPFLGAYPSEEEVSRMCIVSPWMINGDLLQYLEKVPGAPRKPLVRDILSGLQYLHDMEIVHADIKAKNVLVSETGKAMLADFGTSRLSITLNTNLSNVGAGTIRWMAPELLLDYEPHTCESDVWAFACTCYEIITGAVPFGEHTHLQSLKYAFKKGNIIPEEPEEPGIGWDNDVWSLAMRCWKSDPASRPRAHELLDMINGFNFPDDRPSDPESKRSPSLIKVDYSCVLSILNEIRVSAGI